MSRNNIDYDKSKAWLIYFFAPLTNTLIEKAA